MHPVKSPLAHCQSAHTILDVDDWNRWQTRRADKRLRKIAAMVKDRYLKVEIARKFKISRARLYQLIAKAKKQGLL